MKKLMTTLAVLMMFPCVSSADLGLLTGASWGIGKMSSSASTLQSRSINNLAIHALPGYEFPVIGLLVGPMLEYQFVGQSTEVATVGNTNVKGSGYLAGIGGSYKIAGFFAAVSFDFFGKYTLSRNDIAGREIGFKKPMGFHVIGGYMFMPNISGDINFIWEQYSSTTIAGADTDISSDKFKEWAVRLGASYHL